jgi:hypothetical protein
MHNMSSRTLPLSEYDRTSHPLHFIVSLTTLLQIRPRCHYCRNNIPCPSLECSNCTNRIIVPDPYRSSQDRRRFVCPACDNSTTKVATIISQETTTRALNSENGIAWLGFSISDGVFEGKSAFKLMELHGAGIFGEQPVVSSTLKLSLNGKKVQDPAQAFAQIERRVGRGEVELGSCALCYEEMLKTKLVPACGRTGCGQKVDEGCLHEWVGFAFFCCIQHLHIIERQYGKNEPGKLLNLMQLACPFCRRKPATKVLTKYNRGAAALCGLQDAMDDRRFFYAWCIGCGFAKTAYERVCCDGDRVPGVEDFRCAECSRPIARPARPTVVEQTPLKLTACPKCDVVVEKVHTDIYVPS